MGELRQFVHRPIGALQPYVREIMWVGSERPRQQMLLPETRLTLVLRQSGAASMRNQVLPKAVVSGVQHQPRVIEHSRGSSLIIVRFTEIGAHAIFHERMDLLYGRTEPLDAMMPAREVDRVQNALADTPDARNQLLHVERFLTSRIRALYGVPQQIQAAVQMIRNSDGRSSIGAIAQRTAMSQSALERHFRAAVGATPKRMSRLARLHHVFRLWATGKNFTRIAYEAGYFDQPHLVRDFRLFTGFSPEEFFRMDPAHNLPIFYK
jgi:AraC-like DNA-binding protein